MTGWLRYMHDGAVLVRKGKASLPVLAFVPSFTLRTTKPSASNVGAGVIRATPTTQLTSSDSSFGTWSSGVLTLNKDLKDRVVIGTVKDPNGYLIENCIIQGDPAFPTFSVSNSNMINCVAPDTNRTLIRYCTIHSTISTPNYNGIGGRNFTAEFNDISLVTDGFSPSKASNNNLSITVAGNYVHDHIFYGGADSGHPAASSNYAADGTYVGDTWANQGWNHSDAMQLEQDGVTGINVYGNFFDARWYPAAPSMLPLPLARKQLSCFMLNAGTDIVIEDNWLNGGEYVINNADSSVTGVVRRNRFGPNVQKVGGTGLPYALMLSSPNLRTFDADPVNRNVWESDGTLVARRNSVEAA